VNDQPPSLLPEGWTPQQALAAFELIELLRDQLWARYGPDIQRAMRLDRVSRSRSPSTTRPSDTDPPF